MVEGTGSEASGGAALITWGVAERAMPGQEASGDGFLVEVFVNGALAVVVDGLGHGEEAAAAAGQAVELFKQHAHEAPVALVEYCNRALRNTRGAVMSLASYQASDNTLTWLGVGNVEGILCRAGASPGPSERLISCRGVVGYQLPPLRPEVLSVEEGDLLILVTDGIRSSFADELPPAGTPQQIADYLLKQHAKESDDALVLVVRYEGADHGGRL